MIWNMRNAEENCVQKNLTSHKRNEVFVEIRKHVCVSGQLRNKLWEILAREQILSSQNVAPR